MEIRDERGGLRTMINQDGKSYLTTRMLQQHPGGVIGILPERGDYGSATRLVELAKTDDLASPTTLGK
jgi:hypothetical protein